MLHRLSPGTSVPSFTPPCTVRLRRNNTATLRAAVTRIASPPAFAPSRIPALTQHLFEATTNAQQTQSLAPLRAFVHSWAVFVAIERHPPRAARLHELERIVDTGEREPSDAIAEIRAIRATAEAEAGL